MASANGPGRATLVLDEAAPQPRCGGGGGSSSSSSRGVMAAQQKQQQKQQRQQRLNSSSRSLLHHQQLSQMQQPAAAAAAAALAHLEQTNNCRLARGFTGPLSRDADHRYRSGQDVVKTASVYRNVTTKRSKRRAKRAGTQCGAVWRESANLFYKPSRPSHHWPTVKSVPK